MSPILSRLNWAQGFGRRPFVPSGSAIFNNIEDYFSTYNYYGAAVNASYIQEFVGAPTPSTDCPFTGEGEGYNSIEFGLNKTIEITQNGRFNFGSNTSFTVEWWEKRFPLNSGSAIEKDPYMTVMDIGGTSAGLFIGLNGTNQGKYYITIGNGGTVLATEGTGVAADSGWHHYALAVDGLGGNLTQFKFFRDGVETAGTTTNSTDWGASNSDWTVGGQKAYPQNYNFQGRISNFRVTSGICRYKSNFSVPTKPFSDWADGTNINTLFVCCKSASVLGADGDIFANGGLTKKTRVKYFDEGGMVWIKSRTQGNAHFIIDTVRGHTKYLEIGNSAQGTDTGGVVAMSGDGFSVGSDLRVNNSGYFYTSWSFAKNSKIFDLIEYTGNGATSRYIDHSLDGKPGFLLIKNLDQSNNGWVAIHRNAESQTATPSQGVCQWNDSSGTIWNLGDTPDAQYPSLGGPVNKTNQFHVTSNWNNYETSSGAGYLGTNNNGEKYIAYVFAHDESDTGMIRCGHFSTDSGGNSAPNNISYNDIGWEPQWIMTKKVCENSGSTKLLFLQSSTDPLAFTATPGTISYTGSAMSASSDSPFASSGSVTFTGNQSNNIKIQGPANGGGTDLQFGTGAFTVECWIKTTAQEGWIMNNCYNGNGISIAISQDAQQGSGYVGKVEFCEKVNGSVNGHTFSANTVNDGQWHHIAMSRTANGSSTSCFVDGVSVGSHGGTTNHNGTEDCFFGRNKGTTNTAFVGQISNFRITNTHLYGGNFTPSTTPLTETGGYAATSGDWEIWDDKRGVGLYTRYLRANNSDTEQGMLGGKSVSFRARGFRFTGFDQGKRYIYVAIRKGLMGDPKDSKRKAIDLFALARGGSSTSTYHGNNGGFITQVADGGETTEATGQQAYTTPGSYTWTCPANVTKVHAVCIGGGGGGESDDFKAGGGGGLGWKNNIPVVAGQTYTVVVGDGGTQSAAGGNDGGDSYFIDVNTVKGGKGKGADQGGGDFVGDGGGNGGTFHTYGGGGGAGGYSGDGNSETGGSAGRGSANGLTGGGAGGGGVGIMGEGASGANKPWNNNYGQTMEGGGGGSGGADGTDGVCPTFSGGYSGGVTGGPGGNYGGGAGGCSGSPETKLAGNGGKGAVRLIWGEGRAFPATNTADQPANQGTSTAVKSYGFAPDMGFLLQSYDSSGGARETFSRVSGTSSNANVGNSAMQTKWDLDGIIASVDSSWNKWPMNGGNSGGNNLGSNDIIWTWRRAKGFFDTCTWYSNGNDNEPYPHNLGAVPEMIWYRRLDGNMEGMFVYHKDFFQQSQYAVTGQQGIWTGSGVWGDGTVPHTTTHFTMGSTAGNNYWNAAYLFATNPGISKVGSYETLSNGDPQNIDCGFTTGVRALLIKRMTNIPAGDPSVGGWFCFDTARGMATSGVTSGSTTFVSSTGDMLKIQGPNNGGGNGLQFGTGAYTIEFWIKTTANAGWIMFNAGSNTGFRICIGSNGSTGNDGKIQLNEQVSNADDYTSSSSTVNNGQWHHVAISRPAGGSPKIFIDGTHEATGSSGRNCNSNDDCWIGRRQSGGGYALNGQLSNFRVTGAALYTSNFTPSTSPLTQTGDTKLLFCQSDTDALASTVTPGTISYTGGTVAASSDNPFSSAVSPYMRLDNRDAQTSSTWVKKTDEGFRIESGNQLNVAGGQKYIYYAIA